MDKAYYENKFHEKWDALIAEAEKEGGDSTEDIVTMANAAFEECANAEEIVGYYLVYHKEGALKDWIDNTALTVMTEQDKEVDRILRGLFKVRETESGWEVDVENLIFHLCCADKVNYEAPSSLWMWVEVSGLLLVANQKVSMEMIENTYQKGLETIRDLNLDRISRWADSVLKQVEEMEQHLKENGYTDKSFKVSTPNGTEITIQPCVYKSEGKRSDIEYYLTNDFIIDGQENLYKLAECLVNYEELTKSHDNSQKELQKYYEEKVLPIGDKLFDDMTRDEQNVMEYFSDWHKDVYGHRPHTGQNECEKQYNATAGKLPEYTVCSYYDGLFRGLEDKGKFTDWSEVQEFSHTKLMDGHYVCISNEETGEMAELNPDIYRDEFNGEFPVKPEDLEGSEQCWKEDDDIER